MPRPTRPTPEPLDVDSTKVIVAGIVLWIAGFVVLLFFSDQLVDGDDRWLWTCVAGGVLGLTGLALSLRQRRSRETREPAGGEPFPTS